MAKHPVFRSTFTRRLKEMVNAIFSILNICGRHQNVIPSWMVFQEPSIYSLEDDTNIFNMKGLIILIVPSTVNNGGLLVICRAQWSRPINSRDRPPTTTTASISTSTATHINPNTLPSQIPPQIPNPKSQIPIMASSSPPPPTTTILALPPPTSTLTPPSSSLSSKKTPPLPWTHQETVSLIQSYQDKWYSLKRGQLKASQWEEVSFSVASRCGFDEPTKTSTQCRHKMEKLRKRYRAERVKPYPNSWQYFQLMDNMERGPFPVSSLQPPPPGSTHVIDSDSDEYDLRERNKSKSINNILRGGGGLVGNNQNVNGAGSSGVYGRSIGRMMAKGVRESSMTNSRKRMGYYEDSEGDEDDDEDEEVDVDGEGDDDSVAGDGGKELAAEIRGFAERFMRVEKMKIEMMRETERHRMEMEKRRMEMIIDSQRKIVDSIGRAFRAHKKLNTGQEI